MSQESKAEWELHTQTWGVVVKGMILGHTKGQVQVRMRGALWPAALQVQGRGGSSKEMEKAWPVRWEENQEAPAPTPHPRKVSKEEGVTHSVRCC